MTGLKWFVSQNSRGVSSELASAVMPRRGGCSRIASSAGLAMQSQLDCAVGNLHRALAAAMARRSEACSGNSILKSEQVLEALPLFSSCARVAQK